MARNTGPGHDASDRALDERAFEEKEQPTSTQHYDPDQVRKHDDVGRDRLFENRQQHDDADLEAEKTRKARDVHRHHHDVDEHQADSGAPHTGKHKG
jgi:hypothetical protein